MLVYTGIGSRDTPYDMLLYIAEIARYLELLGWHVRHGGATGADQAFGKAVSIANQSVYLPWYGFEGYKGESCYINNPSLPYYHQARQLAIDMHPAGQLLAQKEQKSENHKAKTGKGLPGGGMLKLHSRNIFQVRGHELEDILSKFVVYWAPVDSEGNPTGGTRTAVMYAKQLGIRTYNLAIDQDFDHIMNRVRGIR